MQANNFVYEKRVIWSEMIEDLYYMKRVLVKSVFDSFDYVMQHYYPAGLEEMAEQIIAFIRKNRKVDTLLVHCYAGQSRSRAVGALAVKMVGGDNAKYFAQGNPNMYVYNTLEMVWMQN